jgi:hypothetical protein
MAHSEQSQGATVERFDRSQSPKQGDARKHNDRHGNGVERVVGAC